MSIIFGLIYVFKEILKNVLTDDKFTKMHIFFNSANKFDIR